MIISRINGFTYVQTKFDYATSEGEGIVMEKAVLRRRARQGALLWRGRRNRGC